MPHDESAPDAISSEQLTRLLGQAHRDDSPNDLLGTAVPVLPLNDDDFGAVDLQLAVEQLLKASKGATVLHMLHAGSFLLHCSANGIKRRLAAADSDLSGLSGVLFRAASLALVASIEACLDSINDFIGPLTMVHAERLGGGRVSRKGLISDGALTALGLDVEAYDREFKSRFS